MTFPRLPLDPPTLQVHAARTVTAADVLRQADALDRLSEAYALSVPVLGEHANASALLTQMTTDLQRRAEPLLGHHTTLVSFLDALDTLAVRA